MAKTVTCTQEYSPDPFCYQNFRNIWSQDHFFSHKGLGTQKKQLKPFHKQKQLFSRNQQFPLSYLAYIQYQNLSHVTTDKNKPELSGVLIHGFYSFDYKEYRNNFKINKGLKIKHLSTETHGYYWNPYLVPSASFHQNLSEAIAPSNWSSSKGHIKFPRCTRSQCHCRRANFQGNLRRHSASDDVSLCSCYICHCSCKGLNPM